MDINVFDTDYKPAAVKNVYITMFKVAVLMVILVQAASFIYGFFYALTAPVQLKILLDSLHVTNIGEVYYRILGIALAPLVFAVLAILSPLVGWWIYSRIVPAQQNAVGWGSAAMYCGISSIIGMVTAGAAAKLGISVGLVAALFGLLIILFYTMFFMGIGFNLAKLFKAKL